MKILTTEYQSNEKMRINLQEALAKGYTHFIPSDLNIDIYPDQLEALKHHETPNSIVVDYTIDQYYQNDCRYFGDQTINFNTWMNNINHFPNLIFSIQQVLDVIDEVHCETAFDLAIGLLLNQNVETNGHVIFDFKHTIRTSQTFYQSIKQHEYNAITLFNLNKLAYLHHQKPPFKFRNLALPEPERFVDSLLWKTHFMLPHFITRSVLSRSIEKHQSMSNIYEKQAVELNGAVVFLGFDYGFRGNSRYLFNYFAKHYSKYPAFFITNDATGPHFVSPEHEEAQELIENAEVVVAESYIPDHIKPNGTIIQLWHGTPLKQLFLDSSEPYQNKEIYNYRARKYNKWLHQNYFICDSSHAADLFKSAFPMQYTEVVACGYPRVRYLLDKYKEKTYVQYMKQQLKLDPNKPTLLYLPTWKTDPQPNDMLPLSESLLDHYNVIYRGHIESKEAETQLPQAVIQPAAQIETQDLLLACDVLVSDYSSVVFDALTIDKTVALYTPNLEQYQAERGLYLEVWQDFDKVTYQDAESLTKALINQEIPYIASAYINRDNHSFETIASLIVQHLPKRQKRRKN
ncbi:teichoic acid biosynthesis protein F [Staphylococcus simulans]|uniref:CDP-glycerol glycerophosphotransferase family protein n=1 Tax=Staphylococcus simulans TaxID=1286 RepID=UPI000D1F32F6|nr:CDP-glycerol glycerophosphotransferase family protein [Staphylococcus simulans]PTJ25754.1 teichoic acid biosynthesis protein F [Staphylococcus simulans]RIN71777.1 teichoic acid biosynthesis protein F [Staphylococcus simulans]